MRRLFLLFLFIPNNIIAQKLDIMLIGVSHNYSQYPVQDLSGIHNKIKKFQPEAFFGEFLSSEDEKLVMDYWCKQDNIKRLKNLRSSRSIPADQLTGKIDSLKKLSIADPRNYQLKVDLAHAYYLNQDVANGHYQFWKVFDHLQREPNQQLAAYTDRILRPDLDTTGRSMRRLKTSEYALIAFPMMQQLGISSLMAMDCQDYDLNWNASWAAFDAQFDLFRKDTSASFKTELRSYLSKINRGFARFDSIEKHSTNVTEWLNTDESSAIAASGDFYLPEMYTMNNFPKEEMISKIHWWLMRNKGMCDNVVNRAKKAGVKRVVVIAGANHRKFMQEIFEKIPNVRVRNINEF